MLQKIQQYVLKSKIFVWNVCIICLYIFGWMKRFEKEKEENIDNICILLAFINQKEKEKRRENNMTNEKIDVNKKYTENL